MPITKSAIKKQRADKRKTFINVLARKALKKAVDKARKQSNPKNISEAARALAIASKKKIIHKNKAARILSRISKGA